MHPKEIRKQVLERIYNSYDRYFFNMDDLSDLKADVGEKILDEAIRYLRGHNFIEILGEHIGQQFLNYSALRITSSGIDLVEDPEEFNRLFKIQVNNFSNVSGSNISVNSNSNNQSISAQELTPEVISLLLEIKGATEEKDIERTTTLMDKLRELSLEVFYGVISNGIFQFLVMNNIS